MSISQPHKRGEIGYVLSRSYWNKGLITETINAVIKEAFSVLDLEKITGRFILENFGSKRVMEKGGMKKEGHLRKEFVKPGIPRDLEIYGILKEDNKVIDNG